MLPTYFILKQTYLICTLKSHFLTGYVLDTIEKGQMSKCHKLEFVS